MIKVYHFWFWDLLCRIKQNQFLTLSKKKKQKKQPQWFTICIPDTRDLKNKYFNNNLDFKEQTHRFVIKTFTKNFSRGPMFGL